MPEDLPTSTSTFTVPTGGNTLSFSQIALIVFAGIFAVVLFMIMAHYLRRIHPQSHAPPFSYEPTPDTLTYPPQMAHAWDKRPSSPTSRSHVALPTASRVEVDVEKPLMTGGGGGGERRARIDKDDTILQISSQNIKI